MNKGAKKLGTSLLDLLAPQQCILCDQATNRAEAICAYCEEALQANTACCSGCALPHCPGGLCPDCQSCRFHFQRATAAFVYDRAISYLIAQWKFQGRRALARTVAQLMLRADHQIRRPDILLATPLHWRRQLKRGYNQSEDLRRALLKLRPDLAPVCAHKVRIKRRRSGPPQAQSSRRSRLVNLEGAFSVIGEVADCSVTLIDDVCTTGATASAVAQALLEAGASDVHLWCFARTASR